MTAKKELAVAALQNGTVIDHIPSSVLFDAVKILGIEKLLSGKLSLRLSFLILPHTKLSYLMVLLVILHIYQLRYRYYLIPFLLYTFIILLSV